MIAPLIGFELRLHAGQPVVWGAAALSLSVGFLLVASGFGPDNVRVTSPWLVAEMVGMVSLLLGFVAAPVVASAALRDTDHGMAELIAACPAPRARVLLARLVGAGVVTLGVGALALVGMVAATLLVALPADRVGALTLGAYAGPALLMLAPSAALVSAGLLLVASWTRSALATWVGASILYLGYMGAAALSGSPIMAASAPGEGLGGLATLLDPFGLSVLFDVTRYWTPEQKNTLPLPWLGALGASRVAWGLLGAGCGALALWATPPAERRGASPRELAPPHVDSHGPLPRVEPAPGWAARAWAAAALTAGAEVRALLLRWPTAVLGVAFALLEGVELQGDLFGREYGADLYPTSARVGEALSQPTWLVGILALMFLGAELMWRDRRAGMGGLVLACPAPAGAVVVGRWLALVASLAAVLGVATLTGLATQVVAGFYTIDAGPYALLWVRVGVPLAWLAAAVVALHALSRGPYAGLVVVVAFVLASRQAPRFGLEHPLWRFGVAPPLRWSEMGGLSGGAEAFGAGMLHQGVVSVMLLTLAAVLWRRMDDPLRVRLGALAAWARGEGRVATAALGLGLLATSAGVVASPGLGGAWQRDHGLLDWKEGYERAHRPRAHEPTPEITWVTSRVALFPSEGRVQLSGEYRLLNTDTSPIGGFDVSTRREARRVVIDVDGGEVAAPDEFAVYRVRLSPPLAPGEGTTLRFDLTLDPALSPTDAPVVVPNGTVLLSFLTWPGLGYRAGREITDPREREARGLGPASREEGGDGDAQASTSGRPGLELEISTDPGQEVIAPGERVHSWEEGGRPHARFRTRAPIPGVFGVVSGRFARVSAQVGQVQIAVYHHPSHQVNVPAILAAAGWTLEYGRRSFGPYPWGELSLVEVPSGLPFGGYALPGLILLHEDRVFGVNRQGGGGIDLVARRVIHEVAHQWWGHGAPVADGPGAALLIESLAKYTEMRVMELHLGRAQVDRLLEYERERYLRGRAEADEPPLMQVGEQPWLYYSKGALVMDAVHQLLGEDRVNEALRALLARGAGGRALTPADLKEVLVAGADEGQAAQIRRWLWEVPDEAAAALDPTRRGSPAR